MIFQNKKKYAEQIDKRFEKTPKRNDTSFSFQGSSCVHAQQCIDLAANQYSCLTYTG